jgi:hypothetical protein
MYRYWYNIYKVEERIKPLHIEEELKLKQNYVRPITKERINRWLKWTKYANFRPIILFLYLYSYWIKIIYG